MLLNSRLACLDSKRGRTLAILCLGLVAFLAPQGVRAETGALPAGRALRGHIPAAVATARAVAALDPARTLSLALTLPLRHENELADLLRGQQDPSDARFGQFLTPQQFADRFSPTTAQYDQVIAFARTHGLTIVGTHPNRTVLDVAAPAGQTERAFGLHLKVYQARQNGRYFFAPDAEPTVPSLLGGVVSGVVGLDNAARWHPQAQPRPNSGLSPLFNPNADPLAGSGPNGGLTPSDIKAAYNLGGVTQTGSGQTLALFELDGYNPSDIAAYEAAFGLPNIPLQNVLVNGYSGATGSGADEVTLDIELQAALAPGAAKIIIYEGPNSDAGVVATYNRIATDNLAKQISTSWGEAENWASASVRSAENRAFQQMAAQGQSLYAASGDSGAYDDGAGLSVDDPASQPYICGVGGTTLSTSGAGGPYLSEKTWSNPGNSQRSPFGLGGGGGISTVWGLPSYQSALAGSAASKGSTTRRNVPDVSLDSDPYTGYAIFSGGRWVVYGGTSCAAPLWSAFTALVNQRRVENGLGLLGFANPPLYGLANSSRFATDFHDVADGSTNLYFPAVTGYDNATGLGTLRGAALLADLSGGAGVDLSAGKATFVGRDTTTQGRWKGAYGHQGYRVFGDSASDPSYGAVTVSGQSQYIWAASTSEGRALQKAASASDRVAACVYAPTSFTVDLNLTDGQPHQVEAYGLDWDPSNRAERLDVLDAATGTVLDSRTLTGFSGGAYLLWTLQGHVQLRLTTLGVPNAVLSGLFFDAPGTTAPPPAPTSLTATPGDSQIALSWTSSAGATSYSLYRSTSAGGEGTTPVKTGLTGTGYTDTGLTNGTIYFYTLTALNSAGQSSPSTEASATPMPASSVTAPVLQINSGGGDYTSATSGMWKADNGFTGGDVYTFTNPNVSGTSDPALYRSVRYGPGFSYKLPAAAGNYTLSLHFMEGDRTAAGQRVFNVSVNGAPVLTNFDIFRDAGGQGIADIKSFPVTSDGSGVTVDFRSITTNATAMVSALELVPAGPPTIPPSPTSLTASPGDSQIALSWTASAGATSYSLYRSTSAGGEGTTPVKTGLTGTTYTDTGLTNGATYFYTLTSVNSAGESVPSGEANATPAAAPVPPATTLQINSAGGDYTSATSGLWKADNSFTGGDTYTFTTPAVSGTADPALYRSVRYGPGFSYKLPAAAGSYTLRLYFMEGDRTAPGQRVFNVSVNGAPFLTNFDIFADAGGQGIVDIKSFPVTSDGSGVTVDFRSLTTAATAMVSAIQVVPTSP